MIGIICEKPSAARNFAKALGGLKGVYKGNEYIIVNARGHFYEMDVDMKNQVDPSLANKYVYWDLENLPWNERDIKWEMILKKSVKKSEINDMKKVLKACDEIVIGTDCDPTGEGYMIAANILINIGLDRGKKLSRMIFEDESVGQIQKAFEKRILISDLRGYEEYKKGDYRSKIDFLTMPFTRMATKLGDGRSVLRQGRLKSVIVNLVGQQLDAYNNYQKIPMYSNKFKDENGNIFTDKNAPVFKTQIEVPRDFKDSEVVVDKVERKKKAPPKLIDLATLAAKLAPLGYTSDEVLKTYQQGYEAGYFSYPRTENSHITLEQFNELVGFVDKMADLVGVDKSLLTHRSPRKTHIKDGLAHGANRPGKKIPNSLDELKQFGLCGPLIYTILAKSFLAMVCEDYEYDTHYAHVKDYPEYESNLSKAVVMAWKNVYTEDDEDSDDGVGFGKMASPFVHEGFPLRPKHPTMAWLMKELKRYNVGTGATRTSTYSEVSNQKSKYPLLKDSKGKTTLTDYGQMSYILIKDTNIGSVDFTKKLWEDMKLVSKGQKDPQEGFDEISELSMKDLEIMKTNSLILRKDKGIKMAEQKFEQKEKYSGVFNGQHVSFNRKWSTHRFTDEECEALLLGKTIKLENMPTKKGGTWSPSLKLMLQSYNGHQFFGAGLVNEFPDSYAEHVFTEEEKIALLDGKEIKIDGYLSKGGKLYSAWTSYKDGRIQFNFNRK